MLAYVCKWYGKAPLFIDDCFLFWIADGKSRRMYTCTSAKEQDFLFCISRCLQKQPSVTYCEWERVMNAAVVWKEKNTAKKKKEKEAIFQIACLLSAWYKLAKALPRRERGNRSRRKWLLLLPSFYILTDTLSTQIDGGCAKCIIQIRKGHGIPSCECLTAERPCCVETKYHMRHNSAAPSALRRNK